MAFITNLTHIYDILEYSIDILLIQVGSHPPFLRHFKLCASFHNHQWIQTPVTVWKYPILVKISDFFVLRGLKFDRWSRKSIGHLFLATSCFVHHFVAICNFSVQKSPNWGKISCDLCDLDFWPLTLTFCMDITLVNGNNSWTFYDDIMVGTSSKMCDRQTDGQTDGQMDRQKCS